MKSPTQLSSRFQSFDLEQLIQQCLLLCANQALYLIDKEHYIFYWNHASSELTGWLMHQDLQQAYPEALMVNKNTMTSSVIELLDPLGNKRRIQKEPYPLLDKKGQFAGALVKLTHAKDVPVAQPVSIHSRKENFHGIISRSPSMRAVFQIIENAAETTASVLVRGESGSGKELVAKAIHQLSNRRKAPFLAINCAALSSNLLESELFGHVRGAFTGAIKDHAGLFQRAHGGTLFLDEIAEMPLELQAKLLRVVQEKNYLPVGGTQMIEVDVRLVAATHRSLREQVKRGQFREDLMYRLRVVPIFIPPLRERREDISVLLWHFIALHNSKSMRNIDKIDPAAMRLLLDYSWPGNIRELQNVIEYAFAVGRGSTLRATELPPEFRETQAITAITDTESRVWANTPDDQARAMREALTNHHGAISAAAQSLGMSRVTFWRKRKQYKL